MEGEIHLSMNSLPIETLMSISDYLSGLDLGSFLDANDRCRSIDQDELYWKSRIKRKYGDLSSCSHLIPKDSSARVIYLRLEEGDLRIIEVRDSKTGQTLGKIILDRTLDNNSIIRMIYGLHLSDQYAVIRLMNHRYLFGILYSFINSLFMFEVNAPKTIRRLNSQYESHFRRIEFIDLCYWKQRDPTPDPLPLYCQECSCLDVDTLREETQVTIRCRDCHLVTTNHFY